MIALDRSMFFRVVAGFLKLLPKESSVCPSVFKGFFHGFSGLSLAFPEELRNLGELSTKVSAETKIGLAVNQLSRVRQLLTGTQGGFAWISCGFIVKHP